MAKSTKVTFTLDADTIHRLEKAAEKTGRAKSDLVREAVQDLYHRLGRLSERERLRLLDLFDELVPAIPKRSAAEVQREIRRVRQTRRAGGRRSGR